MSTPGRGVNLGIVHPVPLAVHDVVAISMFSMILATPKIAVPAHQAERFELAASMSGRPHRGTLRGDGATDVAGVALAQRILNVLPDRVQFNGEILDVGVS